MEQYIIFFKTLDNRFIAGGDYSQHMYWGSRLILFIGRELLKAIETINLATLSIEEPTYWPSNNKKSPNLLDFSIIRYIRAILKITVAPYLELSRDQDPVIFTVNNKIMTNDKPFSPKQNSISRSTLDNFILLKTVVDIICAVEDFNRMCCTISRLECNTD